MVRQCFITFFCFLFITVPAQEITLTPSQIEAMFLKQNLQLIAERMNVDIADAAVAQAKLWDNPEISVNQLNFWKSGENKEYSVELSQLFLTANKRRKLVNRERVSKEMAVQDFEDVLRGLKLELRKVIYETEYLQTYQKTVAKEQEILEQLIAAYRKQAAQGNIARTELLRLQSSLLELENEANEVQTSLNEQLRILKSLLNIEPSASIIIEKDNFSGRSPENLSFGSLWEMAQASRPDVKRQQLETLYHEKSLAYEKSMRVPDVTVSANYDRYGGVWPDFFGLGISMELPFFNRNQGNIRAARINIDRSKYLYQKQLNTAQNEIAESFDNYTRAYRFYEKISRNELLSELDDMLDVYTKNFLNKNIGMLEFLDFMSAYKNNKQTVLQSDKNLRTTFEDLQYMVGAEIR